MPYITKRIISKALVHPRCRRQVEEILLLMADVSRGRGGGDHIPAMENLGLLLEGVGALKMEERGGIRFGVPREGLCIGCGTCANICPTGAIHMSDTDGVRTLSIRGEVMGVNALERCEAYGGFFVSQKFIHHVEVQTTDHAAVKEHHRCCHSCAKLFSNRIRSSSRFGRR